MSFDSLSLYIGLDSTLQVLHCYSVIFNASTPKSFNADFTDCVQQHNGQCVMNINLKCERSSRDLKSTSKAQQIDASFKRMNNAEGHSCRTDPALLWNSKPESVVQQEILLYCLQSSNRHVR